MPTRGYKNATRDVRKMFSRFLPTPFRDADDNANKAHQGIVGAVTDLFVKSEAELIDSKKESFLDTATGAFLDKWGSVIGMPRHEDETDAKYRKRLHDYIIAKRGTINAIVDAVKYDFGDDTNIFIYEPWRDIFYLNYSLLNGYHHLQGFYYRYAIIDIHVDQDIDMDRLEKIVDEFKDAGVMVYYTMVSGMRKDAPIYDLSLDVEDVQETIFSQFGYNHYSGYEFTVGAKDTGDLPGSYSVSELAYAFFSVVHLTVNENFNVVYSYDPYVLADKYEPLVNAFTPYIEFNMDNPTGQLLYVPGNATGVVSPEYVKLVNRALKYVTFKLNTETGEAEVVITSDDTDEDDTVFITNDTDLNSLIPLPGNQLHGQDSYNIIFRAPETRLNVDSDIPAFAAANYLYPNDTYSEASVRDNIYADLETGSATYKIDELAQQFLDALSFDTDDDGEITLIKDQPTGLGVNETVVRNYLPIVDFEVDDDGILVYLDGTSDLGNTQFDGVVRDSLSQIVFTLDESTGIISGALSDDMKKENVSLKATTLMAIDNTYSALELAVAFSSIMFMDSDEDGNLLLQMDEYTKDDKYKDIVNTYNYLIEMRINEDGILLYRGETVPYEVGPDMLALIDRAISMIKLRLDDNGDLYSRLETEQEGNTREVQNYAYVAMDFNKWYTYNRATLDMKDFVSGRYLKFSTHGSLYGFNIDKLSIKDRLDKELIDNAEWVYYPEGTTMTSDGTISNSKVSSADYILDLGKEVTLSAMTVSDSYLTPTDRTIAISSDMVNFSNVSHVINTKTGSVPMMEYSQVTDKGSWIAERLGNVRLNINARTINGLSNYFEVWNFRTHIWDNMLIIDSGLRNTEYLIDNLSLKDYLSQDGWFVSRFNPGANVISHLLLNYYGFTISAQGSGNIPDISLVPVARREIVGETELKVIPQENLVEITEKQINTSQAVPHENSVSIEWEK